MTQMNSPQSPAGWYSVDEQHERYWTGTEWAEQTRPRQASATTQPGAVPPGGGSAEQTSAKGLWYRKTWVIAVAALLVGIMLGSASSGAADPRDSSEYRALSDDLETTQAELDTAEDELAAAEDELRDIAGDLPAREDAVNEAEEALKAREAAVKKSEAELRRAEKAIAKRERAVGIAEKEIANNTIPGDGVFEVGADMKPGTYKSAGSGGCYYAVLGDANGNNIKSNNITDGPATASVSAGEYFESTRCADWVLQR